MWQIISGYISNLLMLLVVFTYGSIILNKKPVIKKTYFILLIFILALIQTMLFLKFSGTFKTLAMSIINIYFIKTAFKETYKKSFGLIFIYMSILIILDLLQLFFVTHILNISREFCYETIAGGLISNINICICELLIIYIFRKQLRKIINKKLENNKKITIFSIMTGICTLMFFYNLIKEFRFSDDIFLYLISMIVMMLVLISLIKQTIQNNKLLQEYDNLLEIMVTFENEIEKQRVLRHETKNEFRTIRAKICDNQENKEIIEYIDEIVNDKYEINKEKYAKFGYLPANGIKGLCYFKMQEAEDKGINISINISKKVKASTIYNLNVKEQRDFGRILGVFLDNAIEASVESEGKQLGIEAYVNTDKEFKLIISNTYNNEIDKTKIGLESFSTKGKNRGHGLLLAKQLVGKNNIFETKTEIQDDLYIQTIEIKKI